MDATLTRWAGRGLWLLPVYGTLTLIATFNHQPDPGTEFAAWSEFVTTPFFYGSHLVGSLLGLAVGLLGFLALALLLSSTGHIRRLITAVALQVVGASFVFGLFGVAAFVQPVMGDAFLSGTTQASAWYEAVYEVPAMLIPAATGLVLFSVSTVILASVLAAHRDVPRWATWSYGASGLLIGLFGVAAGILQTVGSLALIASSMVIARRLGREEATAPSVGRTAAVA